MKHNYKGVEFDLEFIQKDKLITVIRTTFTNENGVHPSETTSFADTLETIKNNSELKDKLCDLCLYSHKVIDAAGNFIS